MTDVRSLLANAALALDEKEEKTDYHLSASLPEFKQYFPNLSELTANGMFKKACTLVHHLDKMTTVLGGNLKSRMVACTRLRKRPHLIEKGKTEGQYIIIKRHVHIITRLNCAHMSWLQQKLTKILKCSFSFMQRKRTQRK